jgi:hypothetical protein
VGDQGSHADSANWTPPEIDTSIPHSARMYDYFLGGKDNFPADRGAAEGVLKVFPQMRTVAQENRGLLRRMVQFLAGEAGIRQFLDIGTGIPTSPNVHEIAQAIAPGSRVVYVDNDPIVLAHARALLASDPAGRTAYISADLKDPKRILADGALQETLDLSEPTALLIVGTLHYLLDSDDVYGIVDTLVEALPSGSYVALQQATDDVLPEVVGQESSDAVNDSGVAFQYRTKAQFERFFSGLEFVEPGIAMMAEWRAENEPQPRPSPADASGYGAIGRKP